MESFFIVLNHLFNFIYVIGFLIKDIMWLRIVIIFGCTIELFYDSHSSNWTNFGWCIFVLIANSVQLAILIKERLSLKFTDEEKKLHNLVFQTLNPVELKKLLKSGTWCDIPAETVIIEENTHLNKLMLIYDGIAAVESKNKVIAHIRDGSFAGEMSFLTGSPTAAKVIALTPLRLISWKKDILEDLMNKNAEIQSGIHRVFNTDLVTKLKQQNVKSN